MRTYVPSILTACTLALAGGPAGAGDRPHVLLVTVDTLRADRMSSYGYRRPTSPNIDALLARGLRFTRAHTVEPLTNPALASMLTGVEPHRHGGSRNGLRIEQGLESLPKVLARNGWRTAAFVSNWTLKDNVSRLGEHFGEYGEVFTRRRWLGLLNAEATAADVTDGALAWATDHLDRRPDGAFLLWVHYVEPHAPYRYHKRFAERLGLGGADPPPSDRYDTEVAAVDHEIGRLLKELAERVPPERMLVFFAADHGESLGEHGYWGHGRYLYEQSLAIPMGLVWQGRITPAVVEAPALILDLPPTVLELLGLEVPKGFTGYSWVGVIDGGSPPIDRGICYQAHRGAVHGDRESDRARSKGLLSVGFMRHERKEILRLQNQTHMVFDLGEDPQELSSLVEPKSPPSGELLRCIGQISEGLGALDRVTTNKLDPDDVERLRALGYLDDAE